MRDTPFVSKSNEKKWTISKRACAESCIFDDLTNLAINSAISFSFIQYFLFFLSSSLSCQQWVIHNSTFLTVLINSLNVKKFFRNFHFPHLREWLVFAHCAWAFVKLFSESILGDTCWQFSYPREYRIAGNRKVQW